MAFKYAFNTWAYSSFPCWVPSYSIEETIRRIAGFGYDGIEIGCAAPHAWPAYLSPSHRRDLKSLMDDLNLKPVSLLPAPGGGPGHNVASLLPEERKATIAHYKEVVDLAHDLGADRVLYIAGWRSFGTGYQ
ncbi:MAG: sugar phosphate isomerase/epimerase, partial [Hyphomicrobiales bacterium]